ncbi:MAG: cytidylyltransferase domain-containing protein [Halosimplex sp.]
MNAVVVLQVRMGSSRLPGKAMLPLDGTPALVHEIRRAAAAEPFGVDDVVVATSANDRDDVIEFVAEREGARVYRGSESDVIGRVHRAMAAADADVAVRLCGDNTLIDPQLPTALLEVLQTADADYASTKFERTFPIGHNADAFTRETIRRAADDAESDYHREHVGQYFKDGRERFDTATVTADAVFDESVRNAVPDFSALRLTMDEADDYRLLSRVYESVPHDEILDTADAIRYIAEEELAGINADVEQAVW